MDNDRGGRYGALVSWWARMPENARLVEPARASGYAEDNGRGRGDAG
jgi:hypothetical protein